jgi:hypothetical protein
VEFIHRGNIGLIQRPAQTVFDYLWPRLIEDTRSAAFTFTICKVQVLRLVGFYGLVSTPDAATTEVDDYQKTPGARPSRRQ